MNNNLTQTIENAKNVLAQNTVTLTRNNKTYRYAVPSKEFYVHQWLWDSAIHAMGIVHFDEERAFDEIISLISGQWKNGFIAQITFNPHEQKYFPGPSFWGTDDHWTDGIPTSGITQPPLPAIAAEYIYKASTNKVRAKKLLQKIIPALKRYHQFLKKYRDPEDSGLVTVIHPWESGTDNSPRWDAPLAKISIDSIPGHVKELVNKNRSDDKLGTKEHRPEFDDYYRYMYLVDVFKSYKWDQKQIVKHSPFAVKDILFNALWARANESLALLLHELNDTDASTVSSWNDQTKKALISRWDAGRGVYADIDVAHGNKDIYEDTSAIFVPLWANACTEDIVNSLVKKLQDKNQYGTLFPVPSTSVSSPQFNPLKYWRGPTWAVANLFVVESLNRQQKNEACKKLRDNIVGKTITAINNMGFNEYFHPLSDERLGFGTFSWTAASFLHMYHTYGKTK